jgi:hypothetical protein
VHGHFHVKGSLSFLEAPERRVGDDLRHQCAGPARRHAALLHLFTKRIEGGGPAALLHHTVKTVVHGSLGPASPLAKTILSPAAAYLSLDLADHLLTLPSHSGGHRVPLLCAQLPLFDEGVQPAQIALAWLLHKDGVTAPIVGVTSIEHLEAAVEATELDLSDKDLAWLEEPYQSQAVRGWIRGGGVPREHLHENEPEA